MHHRARLHALSAALVTSTMTAAQLPSALPARPVHTVLPACPLHALTVLLEELMQLAAPTTRFAPIARLDSIHCLVRRCAPAAFQELTLQKEINRVRRAQLENTPVSELQPVQPALQGRSMLTETPPLHAQPVIQGRTPRKARVSRRKARVLVVPGVNRVQQDITITTQKFR